MAEFSKHQVLFSLQPDLNIVVAHWIADLVDRYIYEDAYQLYEDLRQIVLMPDNLGMSDPQLKRVKDWLDNTPVKAIVTALNERGGWGKSSRTPPKATPDQIRIIEEAQREVGLDFTRFFEELTTWEADAVIKGCVAVSEVQRQTGDRHFQLRDLRSAIRLYLTSTVAIPRGKIIKGEGYDRPANTE
jgi:hypothetical protein